MKIAADKAEKKKLISAISAAVISGSALLGVAVISNAKTSPAPNTNTTQAIDCTDEIKEALDIFRQNPQITIPYSSDDPAQQLCQLNERIEQARNAGNP